MPAGSGGQGNAETLRRYWTEGAGGAKIRWGDPGDFDRCVDHLGKYVSGAKGMCNLLHKRALGYYPATHAKMGHSSPNLAEAAAALGIGTPTPAVLALAGSWNSMLHPRIPAGQAGGGKFASGSGGGKGKGAGKGKGKGGAKAKAKPKGKGGGKGGAGAKPKGAKGGGKAGAGAKGGKGAASAALAAQAQQVYQNFLHMNPKQRSEFLAGLTNPQLSAMWKVANAGNTNDPSTRAALIAIKDQMAARSLTGAKGPTAINAAKTAAAAKTTAPGTVVVTAKKPRARKLSHPAGGDAQVPDTAQVALAVPSATSGDGAAVTVNANLRQKYAKTGVALKDGSFPIPDHAHLRKALKAVGRAHPSKRSAVRAHIRKRAKALGVDLSDSKVG